MNQNYQPNNVYYTPPGQFQYLQQEVNQVTDIMRNNVRLELERGTNLDNLQIRADDLNNYSQEFSHSAHEVQKKYWWKNAKMWAIIIVIAIIVLVLIIVFSVLVAQNKI